MVKIVNTVGSGSVDTEFDLPAIAEELDTIADFDGL
jgi:TATA-box binding protein (TBP) (component of TFIID and TFIIIB)